MNSTKLRVTAILMAAILAAAPQVEAAATKTQPSQITKSTAQKGAALAWSVQLGNNVTAKLDHADVWQQTGTNVAVFTLTYKNGGKAQRAWYLIFPRWCFPAVP